MRKVAGRAGGGDILPHRAAALGARHHVVEGQLPVRAAIDAAEAVAQEQVEPGERRIFVGPHIIAKRDDARQLERDARAVHLAVVMGDDVDALQEHRLDRRLPRPQRERVIGQRRVVGVEDQRRAAFGMSDQLGVVHASDNSLSSGSDPNCCSPAPSHVPREGLGRRGRCGPSSLVARRMPTRRDMPMTAFSTTSASRVLSVTALNDCHALRALRRAVGCISATRSALRSAHARARESGGKFRLRIEDLDQTRCRRNSSKRSMTTCAGSGCGGTIRC